MLSQVRYKSAAMTVRGKGKTDAQIFEDIRKQVHSDLHLLIQLTPRSNILLMKLRDAPHLLNQSMLIYFGDWSDSGF